MRAAKAEEKQKGFNERTARLQALLNDAGLPDFELPAKKSSLKRQLSAGCDDDDKFVDSVWSFLQKGQKEEPTLKRSKKFDHDSVDASAPREELEQLRVPELKKLLSSRKLKKVGKKQELVNRLVGAQEFATSLDDLSLFPDVFAGDEYTTTTQQYASSTNGTSSIGNDGGDGSIAEPSETSASAMCVDSAEIVKGPGRNRQAPQRFVAGSSVEDSRSIRKALHSTPGVEFNETPEALELDVGPAESSASKSVDDDIVCDVPNPQPGARVEMLWKDWRWYDAQVIGWSLQKGHKLQYVCDESIEWVKCFFDRDTGYVSWRLSADQTPLFDFKQPSGKSKGTVVKLQSGANQATSTITAKEETIVKQMATQIAERKAKKRARESFEKSLASSIGFTRAKGATVVSRAADAFVRSGVFTKESMQQAVETAAKRLKVLKGALEGAGLSTACLAAQNIKKLPEELRSTVVQFTDSDNDHSSFVAAMKQRHKKDLTKKQEELQVARNKMARELEYCGIPLAFSKQVTTFIPEKGSSWRLGNTVREVVRQYLDGSEVRLSKPNEKYRVGVVNLSHVIKEMKRVRVDQLVHSGVFESITMDTDTISAVLDDYHGFFDGAGDDDDDNDAVVKNIVNMLKERQRYDTQIREFDELLRYTQSELPDEAKGLLDKYFKLERAREDRERAASKAKEDERIQSSQPNQSNLHRWIDIHAGDVRLAKQPEEAEVVAKEVVDTGSQIKVIVYDQDFVQYTNYTTDTLPLPVLKIDALSTTSWDALQTMISAALEATGGCKAIRDWARSCKSTSVAFSCWLQLHPLKNKPKTGRNQGIRIHEDQRSTLGAVARKHLQEGCTVLHVICGSPRLRQLKISKADFAERLSNAADISRCMESFAETLLSEANVDSSLEEVIECGEGLEWQLNRIASQFQEVGRHTGVSLGREQTVNTMLYGATSAKHEFTTSMKTLTHKAVSLVLQSKSQHSLVQFLKADFCLAKKDQIEQTKLQRTKTTMYQSVWAGLGFTGHHAGVRFGREEHFDEITELQATNRGADDSSDEEEDVDAMEKDELVVLKAEAAEELKLDTKELMQQSGGDDSNDEVLPKYGGNHHGVQLNIIGEALAFSKLRKTGHNVVEAAKNVLEWRATCKDIRVRLQQLNDALRCSKQWDASTTVLPGRNAGFCVDQSKLIRNYALGRLAVHDNGHKLQSGEAIFTSSCNHSLKRVELSSHCPQGHSLKHIVLSSTEERQHCNCCAANGRLPDTEQGKLPAGTIMHECKQCDFAVCEDCFLAPDKPDIKEPTEELLPEAKHVASSYVVNEPIVGRSSLKVEELQLYEDCDGKKGGGAGHNTDDNHDGDGDADADADGDGQGNMEGGIDDNSMETESVPSLESSLSDSDESLPSCDACECKGKHWYCCDKCDVRLCVECKQTTGGLLLVVNELVALAKKSEGLTASGRYAFGYGYFEPE
jgi:hypothetical protein